MKNKFVCGSIWTFFGAIQPIFLTGRPSLLRGNPELIGSSSQAHIEILAATSVSSSTVDSYPTFADALRSTGAGDGSSESVIVLDSDPRPPLRHTIQVDTADPTKSLEDGRPTKRQRLHEAPSDALEATASTSTNVNPPTPGGSPKDKVDESIAALLNAPVNPDEFWSIFSDIPEASTSVPDHSRIKEPRVPDNSKNGDATRPIANAPKPDIDLSDQHGARKKNPIEVIAPTRPPQLAVSEGAPYPQSTKGIGPIPSYFYADVIPFYKSSQTKISKIYNGIVSHVPKTRWNDFEFCEGTKLRDKWFEYVPADMIFSTSPTSNTKLERMVWILDRHDFYQSSTRIKKLLLTLLEWIISQQTMFSSKWNARLTSMALERKSILSWVEKETFFPRESLPVIGRVQPHQLHKGFGNVQQWIIWYLHFQDPKSAYLTATAVFGLWLKIHHPKRWQNLMRINSCFWYLMTYYARDDTIPQYMNNLELFRPGKPNQPPDLGVIELNQLRKSTQELQFNHLIIKFRIQPQDILRQENLILDKLFDFHKRIGHVAKEFYTPEEGNSISTKEIYGISALLQTNKNSVTGETSFSIRLIDNSKNIIDSEIISTRLKNILESLRWWHENFNKGLELKGISPVFDPHQSFLKWLDGKLFESKYSLPVFGFINLKSEDIVEGPLGFGTMQKFLINCLTTTPLSDSEPTTATDSLSILSYWYHSYHPKFWKTHIKDNRKFMDYLTKGLVNSCKPSHQIC
ncbi:hypothetical protein PGT21_002540 [Puccinia graminis f. sp. tritici]|uniref:Uncharacterized protein n=1 Tax=Puccinia graminis f. sp. tritici TaxID=56615 RepID=A0A5B0MVU5_PUCGR|nr:hypothetical protein PGT21_002540 [Puccinia graminis f. sp. tritici]KAA1079960.1 hypothetical protein PGTUg99_013750 [Puccinia graminis f. sp. tritici]